MKLNELASKLIEIIRHEIENNIPEIKIKTEIHTFQNILAKNKK